MRSLTLVVIFLFFTLPYCCLAAPIDSLLTELNQTLARKDEYDAQRWNRIQKLSAEFASHQGSNDAKFVLGLRIYDEYKTFKYDSAFVYSQKITRLAEQLGDPRKMEIAKARLAFVLLSSGMFKETFETLNGINSSRLDNAEKVNFYFMKARAYNDLAYYNQDDYYRPIYFTRLLANADTALRYCQPNSYEGLAVQALMTQKTGNLRDGVAVYNQMLRLPGLSQHQLAIGASTLANIYSETGQHDRAFELLLISAIADVKSATKEGVAMFNVANHCYRHGDLTNAYKFIKEARAAATFYRARQRQIEISQFSSIIDGKKIDIIENQRRSLKIYFTIAAVLAVLVAAFATVIFRQLRKLRKADRLISATILELQARNAEQQRLNSGLTQSNNDLAEANNRLAEANTRLAEANKIKEEYIGYYFHNSTQYLAERETLKKKLDALLSTKQYSGVQKMADSINIKQERNELFKGFDTVFLRLFPNFVTQFNTLFKPEDQVQLDDDQMLTAELRIFALIRLGFDNSEQISQMLGYSINTVYAYKTRVKNRALVSKDEFEARVRAM
jgi:hypothetical protein